MDTSTFDLRAVSFGWAVIDAHQNPVTFSVNQIYHNLKQYSGDCFSFSTDRTDKIVESFIPLGNTRCPEPTGNGFSAIGKDDSSDDYAQPPGRALVQYAAKSYDQDRPVFWKNPFGKHRLSFPNVFCLSTKHIGKDELFY